MTEEVPQPVDFWDVLDEAEQTVESWPSWQQRYDADVYGGEAMPPRPPAGSDPPW
jgi:hypothetical protein